MSPKVIPKTHQKSNFHFMEMKTARIVLYSRIILNEKFREENFEGLYRQEE